MNSEENQVAPVDPDYARAVADRSKCKICGRLLPRQHEKTDTLHARSIDTRVVSVMQ